MNTGGDEGIEDDMDAEYDMDVRISALELRIRELAENISQLRREVGTVGMDIVCGVRM